jgi:4-hydroxy-tetrahydrodipicolinate synthase
MHTSITGIIPVMLTPFDERDRIDYGSLEHLIEWYLTLGSDALFAVCQSSEMQRLSLAERLELARFVQRQVAGRVPVIASGHVAEAADDQREELVAMADTGVAAVVLVTNRLDPRCQGSYTFRPRLDALLQALPAELPLGLYECPAPYRRLLADEELRHCAESGRFVVLKDVSCDLATVRRRVQLTEGTPLAIVNANAAIAFEAMQAGSQGFSGVFTNFHPDLYAWLYRHWRERPQLAQELAVFLALAAMAEPLGYPVLAKLWQQRLGNFATTASRVVDFDVHERFWALDALLDKIETGTRDFRQRIAAA